MNPKLLITQAYEPDPCHRVAVILQDENFCLHTGRAGSQLIHRLILSGDATPRKLELSVLLSQADAFV